MTAPIIGTGARPATVRGRRVSRGRRVPGAGSDALVAPQAALISSLTQGVFGDDLPWGKLGIGMCPSMSTTLMMGLSPKS